MAGFLIAIISGALMSVQGVFNTTATKSSSIWVAASFVQITAFATCVLMWFYDGRPPVSGLFQVQPKYALLGGVIGAFITYTVCGQWEASERQRRRLRLSFRRLPWHISLNYSACLAVSGQIFRG